MQPDPNLKPDLAALLSARICHDLVSPVGAIVNGIDLIREIGAAGLDDEFSMISQSASRASGILQFYRLAFGAAANDGERIARTTLKDRAELLIASPRITLAWQGLDGPPLERTEARLLCQVLLCARGIAGMSGLLEISLGSQGTYPMQVTLHGEGASDADERLSLLTGSGIEATPRSVEFALVRATARDMELELDVIRDTQSTVITALRG